MNAWGTLAGAPFVQQLGWTLWHSVWQATAVALLLAVALRAIPARRSDVRYGACCLALLAVCTWFVLTLLVVRSAGPSLRPTLQRRASPRGTWPGDGPRGTSVN
jgi:hypothetical protein